MCQYSENRKFTDKEILWKDLKCVVVVVRRRRRRRRPSVPIEFPRKNIE